MEGSQPDSSVLVIGLNPGEERVIAGKIAMFASGMAPLLSLIQGSSAWFLFCIAFANTGFPFPGGGGGNV